MTRLVLLIALACAAAGCAQPREYELTGQVLAVNAERQELTIRHEDIRGFMPAMTMPFKVKDRRLLDGRRAGDLVRATLVVEETDAWLRRVEATGHAALAEPPPPAPPAPPVEPGGEVADAAFVDQDGQARRLSTWRGRVVAVTFIYTRCPLPNFCPLMDRHFAAVQRAIAADPRLAGGVQLVSVSFDPAFDTPAILKAHAARAEADHASWTFVTGEVAEVDAFASQFGVSILREGATTDEILHNLRTAVIGPDGRLAEVLSGNEWTPPQLLEAIRRAGA